MDTFFVKLWQAVVSGLSIGSVYALIAQGYYVTFITTGALNFGQGEFLMMGALFGLTCYITLGLPYGLAVAGAVVLVGRGDRVAYLHAYGRRALVPAAEPMTPDTIFDLASLTKVVATTTSVMILVEEGKLRLSDAVAAFIPGFERYGKGAITLRQLLTHTSGLRPDLDLADPWTGYETAIARAVEEVPTSAPVQNRPDSSWMSSP